MKTQKTLFSVFMLIALFFSAFGFNQPNKSAQAQSETTTVATVTAPAEPKADDGIVIVYEDVTIVVKQIGNSLVTINKLDHTVKVDCLCNGIVCATQPATEQPNSGETNKAPAGNAASILVHVWYDANTDGSQNNGEKDVQGWTVFAQVAGEKSKHQTDAAGTFTFASYSAGQVYEAGSLFNWTNYQYTTASTKKGTLVAGENRVDVGVIFVKPPTHHRTQYDVPVIIDNGGVQIPSVTINNTIIVYITNINTISIINNNNNTVINNNKVVKDDDDHKCKSNCHNDDDKKDHPKPAPKPYKHQKHPCTCTIVCE